MENEMIKYDFNREWTYYKEGSDGKKKGESAS